MSPAYNLLNSRIHIADKDFALEEGLLPPAQTKGKIHEQFYKLGEIAGIKIKIIDTIFSLISSKSKINHNKFLIIFCEYNAKKRINSGSIKSFLKAVIRKNNRN